MNGIINILKPSGMTSNAVLTKLKKKLNYKKFGHLGTLDPAGTGVLPVTVGKSTRLFDYFLKKDKVYKAIFTFGKETDTLDSEGKVTEISDKIPTRKELEENLNNFIGKISQVPPNFSAKNVNGKRAYELARQGKSFELKPKEVEIYDFKLIDKINDNSYLFEVHCSSGTYVRSLARDLAKSVNSKAIMSAIVRTRSGIFKIEDAVCLDDITKENVEEKIMNPDEVLAGMEKLNLPDKYYDMLMSGKKISNNFAVKNSEFLVYCKKQLFGIGFINENNLLKIKTYLKD